MFKFKGEDVKREEWAWLAIYKDGSYLQQFDDKTTQFNQFSSIVLEDLETFVVYNTQEPQNLSKRFEIYIKEGMTPIFFYRVSILNAREYNETTTRTVCFGYKETIKGKVVKTLMSVFLNGALSIKNDDDREH